MKIKRKQHLFMPDQKGRKITAFDSLEFSEASEQQTEIQTYPGVEVIHNNPISTLKDCAVFPSKPRIL